MVNIYYLGNTILDTRISNQPLSLVCNAQGKPPLNLKWGGLKSSGQRIISLNSNKKSRIQETPTLLTDAVSRTAKNFKRLHDFQRISRLGRCFL